MAGKTERRCGAVLLSFGRLAQRGQSSRERGLANSSRCDQNGHTFRSVESGRSGYFFVG
jgi:hypothetical protein